MSRRRATVGLGTIVVMAGLGVVLGFALSGGASAGAHNAPAVDAPTRPVTSGPGPATASAGSVAGTPTGTPASGGASPASTPSSTTADSVPSPTTTTAPTPAIGGPAGSRYGPTGSPSTTG